MLEYKITIWYYCIGFLYRRRVMKKIFISHSSEDKEIVGELICV